jgi:hypothetical protein
MFRILNVTRFQKRVTFKILTGKAEGKILIQTKKKETQRKKILYVSFLCGFFVKP